MGKWHFTFLILKVKETYGIYSEEDSSATPFYATEFNERGGVFSANGQWIAYQSDESGREEIWVQPYPATGRKIQITSAGGTGPLWSENDRKIFFFRGRTLMEVRVETGVTVRTQGSPQEIATGLRGVNNLQHYDLYPNRDGFAAVRIDDSKPQNQIHIVQNWFKELSQKVPPLE